MYLENRLIAMLDILGFGNQISDKNELKIITVKYAQLINEAKTKIFSPKTMPGSRIASENNFDVGEFVFDTVVLVSHPVDTKSVCKFIFSTIHLMELFFKNKLPLRGSIGVGEYCTDSNNTVFLSNAFKRLSEWEKNQQWTGCILLQEAEDIIISNLLGSIPSDNFKSTPMHKLMIPLQKEDQKGWCLNWSYMLPNNILNKGLRYLEGDPEKIKNTKKYLKEIGSMKDDHQLLPKEFLPARTMKTMKSRSSMRVLFEDGQGNAVEPGCKQWQLIAYEKK